MTNPPKGCEFVVSMSGGKDSTATALLLRERGIPFRAVHMDTGWEHPDTDRYVREVLPRHFGPIEIVSSVPDLDPEAEAIALRVEAIMGRAEPSAMVRWCLKKGTFSSRVRRWCTSVLKVDPFQAWARAEYPDLSTMVCVVGIRAEESSKRAEYPEWSADDDGNDPYWVWRPIIDWTEQDVIDIHHRHGIEPNPLYLRGSARVGCWPCIYCRKAEIRMVDALTPERIAAIEALESVIDAIQAERKAEKGAEKKADASFFPNPRWKQQGDPPTMQIRDVVEWSQTDRRGRHEPFAPLPHETGCARWGLCETQWRGENPQPGLFDGEDA